MALLSYTGLGGEAKGSAAGWQDLQSSKDRSGCAPAFGSQNDASGALYQTVAAHQEMVQSLRESKQDTAAAAPDLVRKQRETVVSAHLMHTRLDRLQPRKKQSDSTGDTGMKELYPRRWYDNIMPFQLPGDDRPTVGQVLNQLEKEGHDAAWQTERKARATEHNSRQAGTVVFWLVVLVLAVTPILERSRLNGPIAPTCFQSESSECEVVPYPRLALYCALAIVVLFKACSVDMTLGPWGAMPQIFTPAYGQTSSLEFVQKEGQHALPRMLTGAVPESERQGFYGFLERVCGVWHGCLGSFAVGVLLLLGFSMHMRDDYALATLSGKPVEEGEVILAKPGVLDDKSVDLSRCLALAQDDLMVVAGEFFGMRNLVLFMCGAILFGMGELFKLRAVQEYPAKGFFGMDFLLRISKPWIWSSQVRRMKIQADELAVNVKFHSRQAAVARLETLGPTPTSASMGSTGEGTPLMEQALDRDLEAQAKQLSEDMCQLADTLLDRSSYNIGQLNFWRIAWAAAFQIAGVALWVPASQVNLEPCLQLSKRWSVANRLVEDAIDQAEILSFGSVCVLIATLCFLAYMPCIPCELKSFSVCNPSNWMIKIAPLEAMWKDFDPEVWLRLVVDGLLLVYICDAIFFGQLGAPLGTIPSSGNVWKYDAEDIPFNPWIIWRLQVILYAAELTARWLGTLCAAGKPSEAEEAAYAVQVQDMLLELLHQVADAGGPAYTALDKTMSTTSASLQVKVFEKSRYNMDYRKGLEGLEDAVKGVPSDEESAFQTHSVAGTGAGGRALPANADGRVLQEFIVDNRWLKAQTDGLSYRNSKVMEDHDVTRPVAPWYSVVFGYDEEDGWVKLEDGSFLPSFVNDVPVLTIPQEDDEAGR